MRRFTCCLSLALVAIGLAAAASKPNVGVAVSRAEVATLNGSCGFRGTDPFTPCLPSCGMQSQQIGQWVPGTGSADTTTPCTTNWSCTYIVRNPQGPLCN
jgi:hypothetical protein